MNDQINSTRIVTDDIGNVVYSAAHGPFGGAQKTWINTYDPKLKFSGKEREGYSDLDYFGARYYDHNSYRFISVDPIINKKEALKNPQLWNLYAYCRNNPITYLDPDGRAYKTSSEYYKLKKEIKNISTQIKTTSFLITLQAGISFIAGGSFFVPPNSKITTRYKKPGKFSRIFKGKNFPEKSNRAGKMQPFNSKGWFMNYDANPGVLKSPFANFSIGFSKGFASGLSGVQMPQAYGKVQFMGQFIGKMIGIVTGRFIK
jgi:RHS repeat-associated protein